MQKIVILNPKGGSGKTTIATNLASFLAVHGRRPAIMDWDPQGSSVRWLKKRDSQRPSIHGIAAYRRPSGVTRSWQLRTPAETEHLIVDTPAALEVQRFAQITQRAHAILVPVLPSDIDIHAAARCISNLLLVAKIDRRDGRLAIVANRVRARTLSYRALMRFLDSLRIPVVARLRDTQNYVYAAERGIGIYEMPAYRVRPDIAQWEPLIEWLERRRPRRLQENQARQGRRSGRAPLDSPRR